MRHDEHALQKAVATYLSRALEQPTWFSSVGHGIWYGDDDKPVGKRGMTARQLRGIRAREAGVKSGVPDIDIVCNGQSYRIELKTARGSVSEAQRITMHALQLAGARVAVCRSLDDVRAALIAWGVPTREHKAPAPIMRALAADLMPAKHTADRTLLADDQ